MSVTERYFSSKISHSWLYLGVMIMKCCLCYMFHAIQFLSVRGVCVAVSEIFVLIITLQKLWHGENFNIMDTSDTKLLRLVHMHALYPQMENFFCNERIAYLFIALILVKWDRKNHEVYVVHSVWLAYSRVVFTDNLDLCPRYACYIFAVSS